MSQHRKTRARCKITSKLTANTPERQNQRRFGVLTVNFEQIADLVLVLFFFTLNMKMLISLNFNLFSCILHRKQTNQSRISDSHIIYDGPLCDNIISGSHYLIDKTTQIQMMWESQTCLSSVSMIKEDKNAEHSSISHSGTFFLFSVRAI